MSVPDRDGIFAPLGPGDPVAVSGYRLAAVLGAGGMGKVYLSHTPAGRPVALKVIRPEFSQDAEFRSRFRQEVAAAQRVHGPYTAPVIDCDPDGTPPWLATAYVPGPSVAAAVAAHGALPPRAVALLAAGIAEALQAVHACGIVHRDLKPANVLLAADGPRVIDFGIARAADTTSLTSSGIVVGTPAFMAPEQAAGGMESPATDVFALGQTVVYAATGAPAFGQGTGPSLLYRIVHQEPELDGVPEELRELVAACLAKEPHDRPAPADLPALCAAVRGEESLRWSDDWLPAAVATELTRRVPGPAPVPGPVPPERGVPGAPPGPPPAFTYTEQVVSGMPTASGPPPGGGFPPGAGYPPGSGYPSGPGAAMGPGSAPPPGRRPSRNRNAVIAGAVAGAAVLLAVGLGSALGGGGDSPSTGEGGTASSSAAAGPGPEGAGATRESGPETPTAAGADSPSSEAPPSPPPAPEPQTYKGIRLPGEYGLRLDDDPVRPVPSGDERDFHYKDYATLRNDQELNADRGNSFVILDPDQKGGLKTCLAETRYLNTVELAKLSTGREICLLTKNGHVGVIVLRGYASEDEQAEYGVFDVTVWRNGTTPAPQDG